METGSITQYIDVAQLVLYIFWIFFLFSIIGMLGMVVPNFGTISRWKYSFIVLFIILRKIPLLTKHKRGF